MLGGVCARDSHQVNVVKRNQFFVLILLISGLSITLSGCRFPSELFFSPESPPPNEFVVTQPTLTATPAPPIATVRSATETPIPCAYAWAEQSQPEVTARIQDALNQMGLASVEALVTAYGENCVDTLNNRVLSFTAMETDFYFTAIVPEIENYENLGNLALRLLRITDQYPPGEVTGPNPGYFTILFQDEQGSLRIRVKLVEAQKARDQGLQGRVFLEALSPVVQ